jgi:hypothetical protein
MTLSTLVPFLSQLPGPPLAAPGHPNGPETYRLRTVHTARWGFGCRTATQSFSSINSPIALASAPELKPPPQRFESTMIVMSSSG